MGRKPISGERKWSQLRIRLTDTERAELDHAAHEAEKSTSAWARDVLLAAARPRRGRKTS